MTGFESVVEEAAIAWLGDLGWQHVPGPVLAPDGQASERESYRTVLLDARLRRALARVNDHLPPDVLEEVRRAVLRLDSPSLVERNHACHKLVREGVSVVIKKDGRERGDAGWLFDYRDPEKNDWLVVSQLTVVDGSNTRRPDLVLYVNGLPLAVVEFKNPEDKGATIEGAHNQLQLYKEQIPALCRRTCQVARKWTTSSPGFPTPSRASALRASPSATLDSVVIPGSWLVRAEWGPFGR